MCMALINKVAVLKEEVHLYLDRKIKPFDLDDNAAIEILQNVGDVFIDCAASGKTVMPGSYLTIGEAVHKVRDYLMGKEVVKL